MWFSIKNFDTVVQPIRFSFYKEELAGETANYIHNRSVVNGKRPVNVLAEVAEEALAAHNRVTVALCACGSEGIHAWTTFVHGYL
jgi:hypothetical protein